MREAANDNSVVNFEFQTFTPSDYEGHQSVDNPSVRGYIVYNDRRKDFGFGTFGVSDSYTIDYDVLNQIKAKHNPFMDDIVSQGGLKINGVWHEVDGRGELSSH
ncbi:hypothetical protein [Alicyclobacillus fastidiosus]|uniref:Uncharacterized protein n=1 Tax=Alicyclobacillus fastidiosus TaxID=392011 RepID=A0ABV5ADH8_9BACL|nr:hypothetical protein [Alicyclobacillus fastidiosus]WEH08642.1 hypothetical protein PYS47_18420 [Alicyclobacillus fastidiosus]